MKLPFFVNSSICFHVFIYFVSSRFEIKSFFKYSIVYDAIDLMINKLDFELKILNVTKLISFRSLFVNKKNWCLDVGKWFGVKKRLALVKFWMKLGCVFMYVKANELCNTLDQIRTLSSIQMWWLTC